LSEAAVSYEFQELEPSDPPPRDAAQRLLAQAAEEAGEIREQARANGLADGRAEGLREAQNEMRSAVTALDDAARGLHALRGEVADAVERDAVEFALALAGKILAGTLQARPEAVADVIQGALRRVSDRRSVTVLVNPQDLRTITDSVGEEQTQSKGFGLQDLQADQRVAPGGAIVRTQEGEIDAGIATQLERAREVIASELEGGGEPA
jgi:flagellar assembly protein FliH